MNKKPLAVVITDTHMHDKNIDLVRDIFDQVFNFCKQKNIPIIFYAGDWFTSRTGQSIACLLATKEILKKMNYLGLKMWAIAGNHDKADQSIPESFLTVFSDDPGFTLVKVTGRFPLIDSGITVDMLPYFTDAVYSDYLTEMAENKPVQASKTKRILITHTAVNGVKNNDGSEVTTAWGQNLFSAWDKVLVGHYHNKSTVGKNIHYIGSAYQANFGEDEAKGLTVILDDGSLEQIRLKFPLYSKYTVNVKEIKAEDLRQLKEMMEQDPEQKLRIILTGTEAEVNSFDKSLIESLGISVEKRPLDVEALEPETEIELVSYNRENITEAFNEFCDSKQITERTYGLELLNKL
jgi:exonuclease SbcD